MSLDLDALTTEDGLEIMPGVRVRLRSLADYRQNEENPVSHTPRNAQAVLESIHKVGACRSGFAADGELLGGNLAWEMMADAGIEGIIEVTTDGNQWVMVNRPDLTPEQRKQAAHGDQWSAMLAEMNVDQLLADIEAGVNLDGIYSEFDFEAILGEAMVEVETGEAPEPKLDKGAELAERYGVQMGQIWALGEHRLAVGDCTDKAVVDAVMRDEKANLCVTDPPYGVNYDPSWRGEDLDQTVHGETIINDDSFSWLSSFAYVPANVLYVWLASNWLATVQTGIEQFGFETKYLIIWNKDLAVMGRGNYHWKHEPCLYMVRKGCKTNWQGARDQKTVWDIATIHSFKRGHNSEEWGLLGHSNQKPLECMERPILNNSAKDEIVYDGFLGSGTTLIACERLGRKCRAIEIEPRYCAVTLDRWSRLTNETPVLISGD